MYKETMKAKGIRTEEKVKVAAFPRSAQSGTKTAKKNEDLTLPPIDKRILNCKLGEKKKVSLPGKSPSLELGSKKMSAPGGSAMGRPRDETFSANVTKSRGESRKKVLRTAAQNYDNAAKKYPGMEDMMNLEYRDNMDDIFVKEPHQAGRMLKPGSPM